MPVTVIIDRCVTSGFEVSHSLMRNAVLLDVFYFITDISNIQWYFILFDDLKGYHGHHRS